MKLSSREKFQILKFINKIDSRMYDESNFTCSFLSRFLSIQRRQEYSELFNNNHYKYDCAWLHDQMFGDNYSIILRKEIRELNEVRINMLLLFMEIYK